MSRRLLFGLLYLFYSFPGMGTDHPPMGGRGFGLAGATVTLQDEWALFNNIGALRSLQHPMTFISFQNLYSIPALNHLGLGIAFPYKKEVTVGGSLYRFGDAYYNLFEGGIGIAHQIQKVSLGIKINYHQIAVQEMGVRRNIIVEFGGLAKISDRLYAGAHIYNLTQAKVSKEPRELIPLIMKAGISFRPFEKLVLTAETEKWLTAKPLFKGAIEYSVIPKLKLRAGCSLKPDVFHAGIGFRDEKLSIDYGISTHPVLGLSQQLSLTYILKKKK